MRVRKQTASGDYSFGNGQLDFYRDVPEAPGQAAQTRLLLWLGEWFLDLAEGTPFMQGILGNHAKDLADRTVIDRLGGTQGVIDVDSFTSVVDPETRGFRLEATLNTIYGPTEIQVANQRNA